MSSFDEPDPASHWLNQVTLAVEAKDWSRLDELCTIIPKAKDDDVSRAIGDGLFIRAAELHEKSDDEAAADCLRLCGNYGVADVQRSPLEWLWGDVLTSQAAALGDSPEGDKLFDLAGTHYQSALRIDPERVEALGNWGVALGRQATTKRDPIVRMQLWKAAADKYELGLAKRPDQGDWHYNWGADLILQARVTEDVRERELLLVDAEEKLSRALKLNPKRGDALNNMATAISSRAALRGDTEEGEALLERGLAFYLAALPVHPNPSEVNFNWGTALVDFAKLKRDTAGRRRLLERAEEKLLEAARLWPENASCHYNLACVAGLNGEPQKAVAHLVEWARTNPGASQDAVERDPDFNSIRYSPELALMVRKLR